MAKPTPDLAAGGKSLDLDVEAAFLYQWAVVFRQGGWPVFLEMLVFVFVLFLGFAYLWKKGAFDWD